MYFSHYVFQAKHIASNEVCCLYASLLNITYLILIGYNEKVVICIGCLVFCNSNRNPVLELPISLPWKKSLES